MKKITLLSIFCFLCLNSWSQGSKLELPDGRKAFCSGMNIAWNNFGNDVGDTPIDSNHFKKLLDDVKSAGGNTVRWWLFTNASTAPKFTNGLVSGLGTQSILNIKKVLDLASQRKMTVILCLFSFDLLQTTQYGVNAYNNKQMLTTDAGVNACVSKCIVPLVTAIGAHSGINCWEIFNEPEGMLPDGGWTNERISMFDIQRFVNRAAGAIHRAVPKVLVSNGSKSFFFLSPTIGKNFYTDIELKNAGGDSDGFLDFYQVHFYDNEGAPGTQHSPFHNDASYWKMDKPILVAEFGAKGYTTNFTMTSEECYKQIYNRGYVGALSWTYTNHDGFGGLPESKNGLNFLHNNYTSNLTFGPVAPSYNFGTNIALGKTTNASTTQNNSTNISRNINDGNESTRWSSQYLDNQWLTIDLQKSYSIKNIVLKWEDAFAKNYEVQISNNLQVWQNMYATNNGLGGTEIHKNLQGDGRYVRLKLNTRASAWGFSLFEIEIYGTLSPITGLEDVLSMRNEFSFPNPFQNELYITNESDNLISIRSLSGELVYSGREQTINTKELSKGIYIISYSDIDGTHINKITKQ